MKPLALCAILSLLIFTSVSDAAIFGADDRKPMILGTPQAKLARSVAVAVLTSLVTENANGTVDLAVDSLSEMCSDEPFVNEPSLSNSCAGFLVGPDLLVTAGHCVYAINTPNQEHRHESELACKSFNWLFDYQADRSGKVKTEGVSKANLYSCKEIVYGTQKERFPFPDYALIRLDRAVAGRAPLRIATTEPRVGDRVSTIGFPFGVPAKLSANARVTLNNTDHSLIVANLDVFMGNSGGPVFNSRNEIIGILVGGTPSMNTYLDPKMNCERFNRCTNDGKECDLPDSDNSKFPHFQIVGSEVQRISPVRELIRSLQK